MADGVNLPAAGTGDTGVKASTQKVTADTSDVQDVSLTSVVGGVRTRNPIIPVSGTVTTTPPANASTNVAQVAGTATAVNTGTASAGTQRVVIATDQAALTNPQPANLYVQGTQADVNGGNRSNGTLRVVLATDQPQLSSAFFVTNAGTFAVQDSQKVADNAGFTDGTTPVQPVGFVFDDVAGTALTENDVAAGRVDSKRAQVLVIEDGTTRGQRLQIDSSGRAFIDLRTLNGTAIDRNAGVAGNGTQRVVVATDQVPLQAGTATLANVAGSATSVTLQASNAARRGLVIVNDSTSILYVKFGSSASTTSFTYFLAGSVGGVPATLELPTVLYTGIVTGIWASAVGSARMTELS